MEKFLQRFESETVYAFLSSIKNDTVKNDKVSYCKKKVKEQHHQTLFLALGIFIPLVIKCSTKSSWAMDIDRFSSHWMCHFF